MQEATLRKAHDWSYRVKTLLNISKLRCITGVRAWVGGRGPRSLRFVFLQSINVNVIIISIFVGRFLLSISYCAKYSTIETNDSFSLEILRDINCMAYALKVCFI